MRSIVILFLLISSVCFASYEPPREIQWKTNISVPNVTIKSTFHLKKREIRKIQIIFDKAKYIFFNKFEKLSCDTNRLNDLEIRVISPNILRHKGYFYAAGPNDFGRYFSNPYTIYIIDDMFYNPEYLAHELGHYFYDKCGVKFANDKIEHVKVYQFQDFFRKASRRSR